MMKVIFVVSALHGGGAERVIATLANRFCLDGIDVTILMTAGNEKAYELESEVKLISIGDASHGNPLRQLGRIFRMRKFFKRNPESAIISFTTTINMFTILAAMGLPNKVIVSERNDPNRCGFKGLRNFIYRFGKEFVFQTEDAKKCFSKAIQERSTVIPNPIRRDLPDPFEGAREKKIAVVGRLEPQKNHAMLLDAFAKFHKNYPQWELHLFGKGKLEQELLMKCKTLKIDDSVIFEGFQKQVLEKIKNYGMYILSSDYEGISNSLMEAMAIGLPVISTDCPIGGSALCITNEYNGMLTALGNSEALWEAMERLAEDAEFANMLGKNATEVKTRFAEETICDMWKSQLT